MEDEKCERAEDFMEELRHLEMSYKISIGCEGSMYLYDEDRKEYVDFHSLNYDR